MIAEMFKQSGDPEIVEATETGAQTKHQTLDTVGTPSAPPLVHSVPPQH